MKLQEITIGIRTFTIECVRVLKLTKKPTSAEFKGIVKISGLGMMLIGSIGFLIMMVKELFIG